MDLATIGSSCPPPADPMKVVFLGAGHVGACTAAVMAFKANVHITVLDTVPSKIDLWNSTTLPLREPGLEPIFKAVHTLSRFEASTRNLTFSTDYQAALEIADMVFICIGTPLMSINDEEIRRADLAHITKVVELIAKHCRARTVVVEKSTVPCGTAQTIRHLLRKGINAGASFEVLSNPEFLSEATAIQNLLAPDRVIIGSQSSYRSRIALEQLAGLYAQWVPRERIVTCSNVTAELSKLIANAMLAQRVSSINAASAMCEAFGADIGDISHICGMDPRIGPGMLNSSFGFGGSCFDKDIRSLIYLAEWKNLNVAADYWKCIVTLNLDQQARFSARIYGVMQRFGDVKYAVLGFAYKKNTPDTRHTPAINLIRGLLALGSEVAVYDPMVPRDCILDQVITEDHLKATASLYICYTAEEACRDANAVIIATNWDEFGNQDQPDEAPEPEHSSPPPDMSLDAQLALDLAQPRRYRGPRLDWETVAVSMLEPRVVFDGHHMLDAAKLEALDLTVESVGIASKL